jgi:DNA-binding NarL/FixJ family response regulator
VVIEDHGALREGVKRILEHAGFELAGEAEDSVSGWEIVERESPDVCIVDILLPDGSGTELARRLLQRSPDLGVVIYTGVEGGPVLADALECGARGLVLKPSPLDDLVTAAESVAEGGAYVDPRLHPLLLSRETTRTIDDLSAREREVLDLLSRGLRGVEIADQLGLSPETIRTHVQNAMTKLEARTRAHAVAIVLRESAGLDGS